MFGIGMPEMILILAVALIVIGPKKLPDLAKSLGKAMGEFKKATSDLKDSMQIDTELKEVKSTFDDIGKEAPKAAPAASAEADAAVATETAAVDEAPADADDSMGQLKAAFDRHGGATEGPVENAPETEPEADSAAKPETDRG